MSYEYLYPRVERLREKPLTSDHLMRRAIEAKLNPLAVRVDNNTGQVFFYFKAELDKEAKKTLDKLIDEAFRGW